MKRLKILIVLSLVGNLVACSSMEVPPLFQEGKPLEMEKGLLFRTFKQDGKSIESVDAEIHLRANMKTRESVLRAENWSLVYMLYPLGLYLTTVGLIEHLPGLADPATANQNLIVGASSLALFFYGSYKVNANMAEAVDIYNGQISQKSLNIQNPIPVLGVTSVGVGQDKVTVPTLGVALNWD